MDQSARDLIRTLKLERHPEGGYYRELYRSSREVRPAPGAATPTSAPTRSAITTIYFLLVEGEPSAWHSVASDEIWHFIQGDPAELVTAHPETLRLATHRLGPVRASGCEPVAAVQAGHWQMARTLGAYSLVGCTVGPGFDFADFKLLRDDPVMQERFRREVEGG